MLVHAVCTIDELVELLEADGDGGDEVDGGTEGVAAAYPFPNGQYGCYAELMCFIYVCCDGDEVFFMGFRETYPVDRFFCVIQGFLGGE